MTLANYTFQLTTTGVVLNADTISVPFIDIDRVSGLDSAPFRETIRDHEGADGGFFDAEFEKGREIILEGIAYCDTSTVESFMDTLKYNYSPVTSPLAFYFKGPGVEERIVFVKPRGVRYDWERLRRTGMTAIQFLLFAEDPRIYSSDLVSGTLPFGSITINGIGFNMGFNIDFGGGQVPASAVLSVGGNRPTPVVFTVNGPVTDPVITNETTDSVLAFKNIQLIAGQELAIDTGNRTVLLDGISNVRSKLVDPDWFLLVPGDNFIGFGAATGTSSTLDYAFRNAWR